jgi:hypothetical protein
LKTWNASMIIVDIESNKLKSFKWYDIFNKASTASELEKLDWSKEGIEGVDLSLFLSFQGNNSELQLELFENAEEDNHRYY